MENGSALERNRQNKGSTISDLSLQPHQPEVRGSTSAILPLPAEVIAQIKSSATITTLTSALLGLVQNSLDAQAIKINVDVDFRRGGCVVEDNGLGIPPPEFGVNGGLGKLYHTSKYSTSVASYGTNGTFIASLASLCLLNITSHHHGHRSTNSVIFHHSKVVSRLVPVSASHSLDCKEHGTRVSVRDLFGNMPVRVKQRSLAIEDRSEQERQWNILKKGLVALLVALGKPVSVKLKDSTTSKSLTISEPKIASDGFFEGTMMGPTLPEKLRVCLSVLRQAGFITPTSVRSWVPASASSRSIIVKGAISLEPAPTKDIQFLSLSGWPLARSAHNEVYDCINKLFNRSNFGVLESQTLTEEEKLRRHQDRRFKQDGLTNKQKLLEKGVDRWPMFILSISFKENTPHSAIDDILRSEAKLGSIINAIDALITSWLAAHHFQPQKNKRKRQDEYGQSDDVSPSSRSVISSDRGRTTTLVARNRATPLPRLEEVTGVNQARRVSTMEARGSPMRPYTGITNFNELSRIKGTNSSLSHTTKELSHSSKRPLTAPIEEQTSEKDSRPLQIRRAKTGLDSPFLDFEPINPGQLSSMFDPRQNTSRPQTEAENTSSPTSSATHVLPVDEVVNWIDPVTKQLHQVNSRTGAAVLPRSDRKHCKGDPDVGDHERQTLFYQSIRLPASEKLTNWAELSDGWLNSFLQKWDNPVFRNTEKGILQASFEFPEETTTGSTGGFRFVAPGQIEKAFNEVSSLNANKITKSALKYAKVIAQVDKKFILVLINAKIGQEDGSDTAKTTLVVIDQHAADERCKVEELLAQLCSPPTGEGASYMSNLGQSSWIQTTVLSNPLVFQIPSREVDLFRSRAKMFSKWGILYDVDAVGKDDGVQAPQDLFVRALPPVIAERCRLEPKILISFLRSELWKFVEHRKRNTGVSVSDITETGERSFVHPEENSRTWLRQIGGLPQGILDMINSRACRSAIMFNDTLSLKECQELVQNVAGCAFPFQCAHGRPSMVPLIDLGLPGLGNLGKQTQVGFGPGSLGHDDNESTSLQTEGFAKAFRKWQSSLLADEADEA